MPGTSAPDGRYDMHELLWQFASECLGKRPQQQTQVRDAHGAVYVNALIQWSSTLRSPQHANTLIEITTEFENVITAVNWMVQQRAFLTPWSMLGLLLLLL